MSTLGYATLETLEKYVPEILSAEFTRELEKQMEDIQQHPEARDSVLSEAKKNLLELLLVFQSREELIGGELVAGLKRYWRQREELGVCPKCNEGVLRIVRSPKSGKVFVGCSGYREGKCDQTFPLPQKGTIVPLERSCEFCGHRMIKVLSGRRTWETCINWTKCPGRQEEIRNLETRRAKSRESKLREEGPSDV
jgi:DNA topoisomerase-1